MGIREFVGGNSKIQRCENWESPKCERKWFEPTQPARTVQRFCSHDCRKQWHYRTRRTDAEHDAYAAEVRAAEDRLLGRVTLDLIPAREEEPPIQIKRRKILTVEAGR
jgi:hypothetical protein